MTHTVLFLCTGNYYRSRFAELLFNDRAAALGLDWGASSRGVAIELGAYNVGPIAGATLAGLAARGVPVNGHHRPPVQCSGADLAGADLVIALDEAEHRKFLRDRFPGWEQRVEYWHVHDLDQTRAGDALAQIDRAVEALVLRLAAETK